ncbi:GLPGLI family protein [Flavobacterium sp. 3HN19-14]|uniref:GLPGLI family protein n=1 Tax=Flavobacterium sp. 3HN19-14 TaxID=3448133 RepID=UPI003EE29564
MPKETTVTAWYTPDIPVNQRPETYWGLPGLILEVNDGKTTILCSKIVLNSKEKAEIKAPKNGQVVSQKEYEKIVADKTAELKEMNQAAEEEEDRWEVFNIKNSKNIQTIKALKLLWISK